MGLNPGIAAALKRQPVIGFPTFMINQGLAYTVSDRQAAIGNNESIFLYIENPENNDGVDFDCAILPRAGGEADVDISDGADPGNTGDAVQPQNLQFGDPNLFNGTVEESVSTDVGTLPSHGTVKIEDFLPGGTQGVKVGPSAINAISFTINEGANALIEVINRSGGGAKLTINVIILQNDGSFKSTL